VFACGKPELLAAPVRSSMNNMDHGASGTTSSFERALDAGERVR